MGNNVQWTMKRWQEFLQSTSQIHRSVCKTVVRSCCENIVVMVAGDSFPLLLLLVLLLISTVVTLSLFLLIFLSIRVSFVIVAANVPPRSDPRLRVNFGKKLFSIWSCALMSWPLAQLQAFMKLFLKLSLLDMRQENKNKRTS